MELYNQPLKPILNRMAVTTAKIAEVYSLKLIQLDAVPPLLDGNYNVYESTKSLARVYENTNYVYRVNQSILAMCLFDITVAFPVRGMRVVIERPSGWRKWVMENLTSDASVLILDHWLVFETNDINDLCLLKLRYNEVRKT